MFPTLSGGFGVLTFIRIGTIAPPVEGIEQWTRPGVPGIASRKKGVAGIPERFRAIIDVVAATPAILKTHRTSLTTDLQGQIVTLTDSHGMVDTDVLITEARLVPLDGGNPRKPLKIFHGTQAGNATHVFTVFLTMVRKGA